MTPDHPAPRVDWVRAIIDNAVTLPPPHLDLRGAEPAPPPPLNLPIRSYGIAQSDVGESVTQWGIGRNLYLYRDIDGITRVLDIAAHDRNGIASLFAGDDFLLARLWPTPRRACAKPASPRQLCDYWLAVHTLLSHHGQLGLVRVPRSWRPLDSEPIAATRAHCAIGILTRRLLRRGTNPHQVLDLAQGWNATRGRGALLEDIVTRMVNAACGRELQRQGVSHAA